MNYQNIYNQLFNELKQFVRTEVYNLLEGLKREEVDEWLTIKEACAYLKITKPTLWALSNKGILEKHYLGDLPRYKRSELDKAFVSFPKNGGGGI